MCNIKLKKTVLTPIFFDGAVANFTCFFCGPALLILPPSRPLPNTASAPASTIRCIFAEMATGRPLLTGTSESDQLARIFRQMGTPTPVMYPGLQELPDYRVRYFLMRWVVFFWFSGERTGGFATILAAM